MARVEKMLGLSELSHYTAAPAPKNMKSLMIAGGTTPTSIQLGLAHAEDNCPPNGSAQAPFCRSGRPLFPHQPFTT